MNLYQEPLEGSWRKEHTPSLFSKSLFYYLQSTGHYNNGPEYYTQRKNLDSMLLMCTSKGTGILKYRDQTYPLTPGSVCIIDCMEEQFYGTDTAKQPDSNRKLDSPRDTPKEKSWVFDWIHFNGSESRGYVSYILNNLGPVIYNSTSSGIHERIFQIHRLVIENGESFDIRASCILVEILTDLMLTVSRGRNGDGISPMVQNAIRFIEHWYQTPVALDNLADELCISKFYLSRQFKLYTGYSPNEYLIKYRLSQSKALLKETDLPVYEISQRVGFDHVSHFIKTFRKQESITPLKFRKYWR